LNVAQIVLSNESCSLGLSELSHVKRCILGGGGLRSLLSSPKTRVIKDPSFGLLSPRGNSFRHRGFLKSDI
jgi:hypothetical protein